MTDCFVILKYVDGWGLDGPEVVCVAPYLKLAEEIVLYLMDNDGPLLDENGYKCNVKYQILPKRCFNDVDTFIKWREG